MSAFFGRIWFEFTTPPMRPRYQARYMDPDFIEDDEKFEDLRDLQFEAWCASKAVAVPVRKIHPAE